MSRVLLLLKHQGNRRLLNDWLQKKHEIVAALDLDIAFDLVIVDALALAQYQNELRQRKAREVPTFLPLLCIASSEDGRAITQRLWRLVDDIISPPVEKNEMQGRIANLLRTRQLSLDLRLHNAELQKRYDELTSLKTELEIKNSALIKLDEQKNNLLGMVAHDLRTPLGVVVAYSEFLQQGSGENWGAEQRDFLAKIRSSSAFMRHLVDDLLDVTQFAAGKMQLHRQNIDLAALIDENASLNSILAAQKQIELKCRRPEQIPPLNADPIKLEQLLNNLLGNAIKFSPQGSQIELAVTVEEGFIHLCVVESRAPQHDTQIGPKFLPI